MYIYIHIHEWTCIYVSSSYLNVYIQQYLYRYIYISLSSYDGNKKVSSKKGCSFSSCVALSEYPGCWATLLYTYMHMYTSVSVFTFIHICLYKYIYACMCAHAQLMCIRHSDEICIYMHVHPWKADIHVCMYTCVDMSIHTYIHAYISI